MSLINGLVKIVVDFPNPRISVNEAQSGTSGSEEIALAVELLNLQDIRLELAGSQEMDIHVLSQPWILRATISADAYGTGGAVRCQSCFGRLFCGLNKGGIRVQERFGHFNVALIFG